MKRLCVSILVAALAVGSDLRAQVDQANVPISPIFSGVNLRLDARQEFTPSFDALDSVLLSFSTMALPLQSGTFAVSIREGGINGPVIGTSDSVSLPARFGGDVLFRFSERVALVPRSTYALQPISLAGSSDWILNTNPGYSGGRLFWRGDFYDSDLVFMEGLGIPEPSTIALLALGAWILLSVRR